MTMAITKFMIKKLVLFSLFTLFLLTPDKSVLASPSTFWTVQAIDTMKTSRDLTLYKRDDKNFDAEIRKELKAVKALGANYVAIDGAYDEEYIPWLSRWVKVAREEGLKVWFRGNFSGWHGWFGPKDMTRKEHLRATKDFILSHPELFEDGDSFTACPECEYGGPGNPLETGDFDGFRRFMLYEYTVMNKAFAKIGKQVHTNWFSINPDVAKAVLDEEIVQAAGNLITLDYFVKDARQLEEGLDFFTQKFPDAKILIGEFGAPIPEINGTMTDDQQVEFVEGVFNLLAKRPEVIGVNYWVSSGGSTALLTKDSEPKKAAEVVKHFFTPGVIKGTLTNTLGDRLKKIPINAVGWSRTVITDKRGNYTLAIPPSTVDIVIGGDKYKAVTRKVVVTREGEIIQDVVLEPRKIGFIYRVRLVAQNIKTQLFQFLEKLRSYAIK